MIDMEYVGTSADAIVTRNGRLMTVRDAVLEAFGMTDDIEDVPGDGEPDDTDEQPADLAPDPNDGPVPAQAGEDS